MVVGVVGSVSSVVAVDSVDSSVVSVDSVDSVEMLIDSVGVEVVSLPVAAGDHDDRDHEADDHRDQPGDQKPHVSVRPATATVAAVAIGRLPHHPGRVVVHGYSSGPRIASRIALVSSISAPVRSRFSISPREAPETAIWVASSRAPRLTRATGRRGLGLGCLGHCLDGPQPGALRARLGNVVELIGDRAEPLGDDTVGALGGLFDHTLRLLLGVVDDRGGGALGGVDDLRQPLRGFGDSVWVATIWGKLRWRSSTRSL